MGYVGCIGLYNLWYVTEDVYILIPLNFVSNVKIKLEMRNNQELRGEEKNGRLMVTFKLCILSYHLE